MKKLSIKLKLTLWFTGFMLVLSGTVLVFIWLISSISSTKDLRSSLMALVEQNMDEVTLADGRIEIEDDFIYYHNSLYCLIFTGEGEKMGGIIPYDGLDNEPFENAVMRKVVSSGQAYLIYDRQMSRREGDIWLRGIVLENAGALNLSSVIFAAFIALPLLIILAAVGGYLLAGSSLRPIQKMRATAEEIGASGDLSKRIELSASGDELSQLANTFNGMFDRLEKNFEAERHFTSDASHELRTPVTTILAQCEYAFENAKGEQELYETIGSIQRQGYRISRLIESLLAFTRMEQAAGTDMLEITDVSLLTETVCNDLRDKTAKNITLTADIEPGLKISANAPLFIRMLENLIQNACRYGRENGKINVSLRQTDERLTLCVADDGIGIALEEQQKIWNRFYRVDKSRSWNKSVGMGLGLSMVKQIVQLHGGRICLESELGKGSTFTVLLPAPGTMEKI